MSNQKFVGIGEMVVSTEATDILIAPNLGSCLGLGVYNPVTHICGMIHCLLPLSKSDPGKAAQNPCLYVDTGVPLLLEQILKGGGDKKQLKLFAAGCASINDTQNYFEIGKKNHTVLKKILWKNNLLLQSEHTGEGVSRTLSIEVGSGKARLKVGGELLEL